MEPLEDLAALLCERVDSREMKRALSVKMVMGGLSGEEVAAHLGVCEQYVSKWKLRYQSGGAAALRLGYRGSVGFLSPEQKAQVLAWLRARLEQKLPVGVEVLRDYIQGHFDVVYRSRQSYYALLHAANASFHKTQKQNPKRDEKQVQERREAIKKKSEPSGARFGPVS